MVALDSTQDGRAVAKALKKPPPPGKAKKFGDETSSLLFAIPAGSYRAWLEDKVSQSWGRARRCVLQASS